MNEKEKYEAIWQHPEYRAHSPAEAILPGIRANAYFFGPVIDYGCGSGKIALELAKAGIGWLGVDIAYNALDDDVKAYGSPFVVAAIAETDGWLRGGSGLCVDVLEHIPHNELVQTLRAMKAGVDTLFVQVADFEEQHGRALIGEPLHLIFKDRQEWRELLSEVFTLVEDADFGDDSGLPRYDFVCYA